MKNKKQKGIKFLIAWWLVIGIFEAHWLTTGVTDLWAVIGLPGFAAVLTFIIAKWSLRLF